MNNNHQKKSKPGQALRKSGCPQEAAGTFVNKPAFSRWSQFESAVLSKVKNPEECKKIIAQRQEEVDDDNNEADLVAAHIRTMLVDARHDPDTCCLFLTTSEITCWVQQATGTKKPINKMTPYLKRLAIPELRYSKKNGVPGWVWTGRATKAGQTAKSFSVAKVIPKNWVPPGPSS